MERLTKRNEADTAYYYPDCFERCDGTGSGMECGHCDIQDAICERLGKYEDLEEQGKLLRLPCAVGTKVYCIMTGMTGEHPTIFFQYFDPGMLERFGHSVFLTMEEARAAVERMKG